MIDDAERAFATTPPEACRRAVQVRAGSGATFPELVRRTFSQMAKVAATPHDVRLSPYKDDEVERIAALTPPQIEAELVARGYPTKEAARIVEESAAAAL